IIPFVIPLADFFMLVGLLTGNASKIAGYYLVFMLVDTLVALLAYSFERERIVELLWLIPQRLIWRWLMWIVLFRAVRRAFKGELQLWGVLKRTGNVTGDGRRPVSRSWKLKNFIPSLHNLFQKRQ
ncbi:MAG TPA: hypothetical protein VGM89_10515, partial [Puia sp.]